MEWRDEGIILGLRKHGETSVIAEVMTKAHGRHLGIVRGGRSKRLQPVLQPGNSVDLVWRARLDEHLGQYQVELLNARAGRLMESAIGVHGVQAMAALLRLLPERDSIRGCTMRSRSFSTAWIRRRKPGRFMSGSNSRCLKTSASDLI